MAPCKQNVRARRAQMKARIQDLFLFSGAEQKTQLQRKEEKTNKHRRKQNKTEPLIITVPKAKRQPTMFRWKVRRNCLF